ncbi:MAG: hypothetical protein ACO3RS_05485 [Candidatus Puniceispirillaceae bacterium]
MTVGDSRGVSAKSLADDYQLDDQVGYKLRLASQRHLEIFSRQLPD